MSREVEEILVKEIKRLHGANNCESDTKLINENILTMCEIAKLFQNLV